MTKKNDGAVDIAELIKRMKSDRSNLVGGGTPQEAIDQLAEELGTSLPPSYVEFLRAFDGGEFGFARMHCITQNGAGWFDFRQQLREFFSNNPWMGVRHLIPIACSYAGDTYCFDLSEITDDEPAVCMVDHEGDDMQELRYEAPSLAAWIGAHYENCDTHPRRIVVYVSCAEDLESFAGDDVSLDSTTGNDSLAKRCHFQNESDTVWAVDHEVRDQIGKFLDRALNSVQSPIDLFIYDDMEMNSAAPWKVPFATVTVRGKAHELYAGDYLRFQPGGTAEYIPPTPLENHVQYKTERRMSCSFCGKTDQEVRKLIAGPGVNICDECVELCDDILKEEILDPA